MKYSRAESPRTSISLLTIGLKANNFSDFKIELVAHKSWASVKAQKIREDC